MKCNKVTGRLLYESMKCYKVTGRLHKLLCLLLLYPSLVVRQGNQ